MAELTTSSCCETESQASCCEPRAKAECCDASAHAEGSCGCTAGRRRRFADPDQHRVRDRDRTDLPGAGGKLDGLAVRVPLLNASLTDAVFEVSRPTTIDEVNELLKEAADGPLAGILGYEERPLVSIDYKDDPRSGIVDALSTRVTDGTQVKVLAWYDNEWGYANRIVELAAILAGSLSAA